MLGNFKHYLTTQRWKFEFFGDLIAPLTADLRVFILVLNPLLSRCYLARSFDRNNKYIRILFLYLFILQCCIPATPSAKTTREELFSTPFAGSRRNSKKSLREVKIASFKRRLTRLIQTGINSGNDS